MKVVAGCTVMQPEDTDQVGAVEQVPPFAVVQERLPQVQLPVGSAARILKMRLFVGSLSQKASWVKFTPVPVLVSFSRMMKSRWGVLPRGLVRLVTWKVLWQWCHWV